MLLWSLQISSIVVLKHDLHSICVVPSSYWLMQSLVYGFNWIQYPVNTKKIWTFFVPDYDAGLLAVITLIAAAIQKCSWDTHGRCCFLNDGSITGTVSQQRSFLVWRWSFLQFSWSVLLLLCWYLLHQYMLKRSLPHPRLWSQPQPQLRLQAQSTWISLTSSRMLAHSIHSWAILSPRKSSPPSRSGPTTRRMESPSSSPRTRRSHPSGRRPSPTLPRTSSGPSASSMHFPTTTAWQTSRMWAS